ncbi:HBL249Cp [Eremothecium sinecaudum]|uniref:Small ribosomal subunit protein mS33 n=1 Tax=Eremothecium sinecaudum TaxID=45286 RepID=A0A109UW93_9SACH|nr:HBL249Cp [Eremothecium sinecaudum]AMD18653.1 HBL249Cp [Eremothecium sinecaudum]
MSVPKERLLKVAKLSAQIFDENFNPTGIRTGASILSKRLKGPAIVDYYGNTEFIKLKQLNQLFPGVKFTDEAEDYRVQMVEQRKRRGKGAPTKKNAPNDKKKKR